MPADPPVFLPPASIRRRLASLLYESLLLLSVLFIGFLLPNMLLGVIAKTALPGSLAALHAGAVIAAYFLWFWRRTGQTLAMRTWKIRLASINGGRPSDAQLLFRFLTAWPSLLFFGIGLLWAVFDRDRQFLHDRLCATRLVQL